MMNSKAENHNQALILKQNRCDRIIAALMSSTDCRWVLDQINSCLLNFETVCIHMETKPNSGKAAYLHI